MSAFSAMLALSSWSAACLADASCSTFSSTYYVVAKPFVDGMSDFSASSPMLTHSSADSLYTSLSPSIFYWSFLEKSS